MKDRYGRVINYIRISITDRCNLRCFYCMPKTGIEYAAPDELLSFEEIVRICEQSAQLGITKVKLTGGEPLMRANAASLVGMIHRVPGIEQVTMTTNGILLEQYMEELIRNGLDAVNISLDTLDADRYHEITRNGDLEDALRGLEAAIQSGIPVKVNTVLYPGEDWKQMTHLAKEHPVDVRFIETMPIGMGCEYGGTSKQDILHYFEGQGLTLQREEALHGNGPAEYYRVDGYKGHIGIIAPMHGKFCGNCNRIRLSATGKIKPCLCFGEEYDVRAVLRAGGSSDLAEILKEAILAKPMEHRFTEKEYITETRTMSGIGG